MYREKEDCIWHFTSRNFSLDETSVTWSSITSCHLWWRCLSFSMWKIEFFVIPRIFIVQVLKIKLFEQKYRKYSLLLRNHLKIWEGKNFVVIHKRLLCHWSKYLSFFSFFFSRKLNWTKCCFWVNFLSFYCIAVSVSFSGKRIYQTFQQLRNLSSNVWSEKLSLVAVS